MGLFGSGTANRPVEQRGTVTAPIETNAVSEVRVPLGETGISVFPLMLGAAEFGWNVDQRTSHELLDLYLDYGGNAVHTADGFSGGRSEHIIGEWLRTRSNRSGVVLSARIGAHADNPGLGSVNLVRAVEGSLTRLAVDHLDVLYLDATLDSTTNLEDTLATVEWMRESGKIRAVGAYRFAAERLVEARILAAAGYPRIDVVDEPYNLLRRKPFEGDLRFVVGAQGIAATPSQALQHGFLSGRHRTKSVPAASGVRAEQIRGHLNRQGTRILRALDQVAAEVGAPVATVAIAWLLSQRAVTAPIVNAFAAAHVEELVQASLIRLTPDQIAELVRISA